MRLIKIQSDKNHFTMIPRWVSVSALTLLFVSVMSSCQQSPQMGEVYRPISSENGKVAANSKSEQRNNILETRSAVGATDQQAPSNGNASNQSMAANNIPKYQQDFMHCLNFLANTPIDYSNPEGRRCYNVVYENCRGCRVDENLRPIDTFNAYGFSGRVAWPAHEDWWPELSPHLSPDRRYINFQSPYFSGHGGAYPHSRGQHPQGQYPRGQYPQGQYNNRMPAQHYPNGRMGQGNPFVYCGHYQNNEPCQLDAVKVWTAAAIDKGYGYNLAQGKHYDYVYTIAQPLNQPCNQHQIRQGGRVCDQRFRSNFGNLLGGLKNSGQNIAGGFKNNGKMLVDSLGASLMASIPSLSVGSLLPTISAGSPGNYTVSQAGQYTVGGGAQNYGLSSQGHYSVSGAGNYTTSQAGQYMVGGGTQNYGLGGNPHYSTGAHQNLGMYANHPMAAYGHYLNYTAPQNRYTIGGSVRCSEQYRNHPGYTWACQNIY